MRIELNDDSMKIKQNYLDVIIKAYNMSPRQRYCALVWLFDYNSRSSLLFYCSSKVECTEDFVVKQILCILDNRCVTKYSISVCMLNFSTNSTNMYVRCGINRQEIFDGVAIIGHINHFIANSRKVIRVTLCDNIRVRVQHNNININD